MERRGSLAQRTRQRFTDVYERLVRHHTTSQGLQQDQQPQEQQQQEQQQREEQQEQQNEGRPQKLQRERQCEGQETRDTSERGEFDTKNTETQSTHVLIHRDTGTQTSQDPNHWDQSPQKDRTSIYHDAATQTERNPKYDEPRAQIEVVPARQDYSNTNEEIERSVPAAGVSTTTTGTIHSQAAQNPGKVAVSVDSVTGLPLMLLTHRLMFVVNQIRSKGQLVEDLVENTTKIVQEVQARRQTISRLEEELHNDDTPDERKVVLQQEIADTEAISEERRKEMFSIDDDQERESRDLQILRAEFLTHLEQALCDANTLEPTPKRFNATKEEEQEDTNLEQASPDYQASGNTVVSDGKLDLQAEIDAVLNNLEDARTYFYEMEEQFEDRAGMYKRHLDSYTQAVEAGVTSMTMTEFDLNYVKNVSNLTACLKEAEKDYEAAFAEAQRLNILLDDDQRSYIASRPSDGYRTSFEAELVSTAPAGFIEKWRKSAVGGENLDSAAVGAHTHTKQPEIDDWEAKTIQSSQSWDAQERERRWMAVDRNLNPFYRKRIDRWQEEMDYIRSEWFESHPPPGSSNDSV
ncbi:hypothetical protein MMC27_000067 [Xylographa pallens]|nr:hypothetical protein [Xylographa pallens]